MSIRGKTTETSAPQRDLLGLSFTQLEAWFKELGEPAYRARQVYNWIYKHLVTDFAAMSNLPLSLRERLAREATIGQVIVRSEQRSKDDRTRKILLELADGRLIESVLMLYPPLGGSSARATVCVSSQAGCAFGCTFCATGQMGFERHLSAGEIVAQVLHFARELRAAPWRARGLPGSQPIDHITNLVFMGMGEPLHNYDNVIHALRILNSAEGFNLGARHMTISTVGLPHGIRRLSQEGLQVNLAISLHAPNDELRAQTMPVNRKYPLAEVLAACQDYIAATRRQITFEYVLLAGVNDSPACAHQLGELLSPLKQYAHVNCIPVNKTAADYRPPGPEVIRRFRDILFEHGVSNSVRAERGDDIAAACGQLRTRFVAQQRIALALSSRPEPEPARHQ
ncbi:MAG: 23S rRNA (adenine(2503)-C(2))-methyltransferase RlmN [Thermogemmatispora sp.]|jgi:23S rRNA (adenine2503-C2)-methyltransferase|uniref:Probable dual-specificity RNA methyltransferase RlmN n=1 Tax=Thermogemmatispora aurantia TaxID=2045279 RepID=A0A5J4K971_9CHLR|nr:MULTISPECIES: 23S rRNA (adenine(2503)-C(2))-methyltransferase RlmN [Thermogemmatispora]MBE3564400.1 23S rRNA (adenine(2503)-C(2))-methyltransferase RlmN [Thermogemmatispora sp.]GER82686.1 putative dual-specificity RNA methyltransferase RlmN [Thermogemmatispora aurantia]